MTPIVIETMDQMGKLFDLKDWHDHSLWDGEKQSVEAILHGLHTLSFTDEARNFLYEHDLYYPRQFDIAWECEEFQEESVTVYEFWGAFYLPDDYAVLFKLTVL